MTVAVRSASQRDEQAVLGVITLAFGNDPLARWALPDPATYLAVMPEFARAFGGNGFAHRAAHIVDGGLGAAMWLPPGVEPDSERMMELVTAHVPAGRVHNMMQVFERMTAHHPTEPCW